MATGMHTIDLRDIATDAIAHWERRRILYNLVLLAVVVATWWLDVGPARRAPSFELAQQLFLFAVLANVAFFGSPSVALVGGLLMGLVAVPYARAWWRSVRSPR